MHISVNKRGLNGLKDISACLDMTFADMTFSEILGQEKQTHLRKQLSRSLPL